MGDICKQGGTYRETDQEGRVRKRICYSIYGKIDFSRIDFAEVIDLGVEVRLNKLEKADSNGNVYENIEFSTKPMCAKRMSAQSERYGLRLRTSEVVEFEIEFPEEFKPSTNIICGYQFFNGDSRTNYSVEPSCVLTPEGKIKFDYGVFVTEKVYLQAIYFGYRKYE